MRRNALLGALALAIATRTIFAADLPPITPIPSQNVLMSQLVRVIDINPLVGQPPLGILGTPVGSDPLADGRVAVRKDRRITLQIRGASAVATYAALFCRFAFPFNPGCASLGQLTTDSDGDANATMTFPAAAGSDA